MWGTRVAPRRGNSTDADARNNPILPGSMILCVGECCRLTDPDEVSGASVARRL